MIQLGDLVLCQPYWDFGVQHNYDILPGRVTGILVSEDGDTVEVKWHDGHVSYESEDELRLASAS